MATKKEPGYRALHARLNQFRGKPMKCDVCGRDSDGWYEWALDINQVTTKNLRWEKGLPFSLDPSDYVRVDRSCHRRVLDQGDPAPIQTKLSEHADAIKELYLVQEWSSDQIARHLGVAKRSLLVWMHSNGINVRLPRNIPVVDLVPHRDEIVSASNAGESLRSIARRFNTNHTQVRKVLLNGQA